MGLNTVGLDTVGLDTVGLETVGLEIVGLETVGLGILSLDTVTILDIVHLNTVVQHIGPVLGYSDNSPKKVLIHCPGHVDLSSLSLMSDICGGHPGKHWVHLARGAHHVAGVLAPEEEIVFVCGGDDAYPFPRTDVVALVAPLLFCLFLLPKACSLLAGPGAGLEAYLSSLMKC